jgi:hypothetical protein
MGSAIKNQGRRRITYLLNTVERFHLRVVELDVALLLKVLERREQQLVVLVHEAPSSLLAVEVSDQSRAHPTQLDLLTGQCR